MYLDKKQNIFKNIWFNLAVVTTITLIFALISQFVDSFRGGDKIISTYLTIGIVALFAQFFLYLKKPVKHSSLHYLYIIFSINISLFVGYILEKFILYEVVYNSHPAWWQRWFITPIVVFAIIFLIKTILWLVLNVVYKKRVEKDAYQDNLEKENQTLKVKINILKEQLETKSKDPEKEVDNLNKEIDKKQSNIEKITQNDIVESNKEIKNDQNENPNVSSVEENKEL